MRHYLLLLLTLLPLESFANDDYSKGVEKVYNLYLRSTSLTDYESLSRLKGEYLQCSYTSFHNLVQTHGKEQELYFGKQISKVKVEEIKIYHGSELFKVEKKKSIPSGDDNTLASKVEKDQNGLLSIKESLPIYQFFDWVLGKEQEQVTTRFSVIENKLIISSSSRQGIGEHYVLGDKKAKNGEDLLYIYICNDTTQALTDAPKVNNDEGIKPALINSDGKQEGQRDNALRH